MVAENKINTLPEGWIWTTIGEIGIVASGGTPSTRNPEFWGGDIAWITPADLSNYKDVYIDKGARSITKVGLEYSSAKLLPRGSILFSSRAPIGYVVIAKNEMSTNQGFKNIILTESLLSEYVYYYLKTIKPLAEKMASGTTFLELSATKFTQIPFPLPPLPEQHRIVAKIEELFSELDHAEDGLKKAQKQLEVYKQALLKSAFEGKLKKKVNGEWNKNKLGEVYTFIGGGTPSKKVQSYWNGNIFWASVKDINEMYLTKTQDKISIEGLKNSASNIARKNDVILVSRINPGAVTIANVDVAINQDLKIVKSKKGNDDFKFIYYHFKYLQHEIIRNSKGTTVNGIRLYELQNIEVEVPDLPIQTNIVFELEWQFSNIEKLEATINEGLSKIVLVRHSILKKAFEGKLVNQMEGLEPAQQLLARIQIEKKKYLEKSIANFALDKKPMIKKPLIEILNETFVGKEFSFEDINAKAFLQYESLKNELYRLLDESTLETVFDQKLQKIQFKYKP